MYFQNLTDDLKQSQQFAVVLQLIVSFVGLGDTDRWNHRNIQYYGICGQGADKRIRYSKSARSYPNFRNSKILQESVFITTISGYIGLFLGILVLENIGLTLEEYS